MKVKTAQKHKPTCVVLFLLTLPIIFAACGTRMELSSEGIYNGQVADYDGDGDFDIFRYPHHEATVYYLLENKLQ